LKNKSFQKKGISPKRCSGISS